MQTLRSKLLQIQGSRTTFAQTEDSSDKKGGKSSYKFTAGWEIVEFIKAQMDKMKIMLESSTVDERHEIISYPVYKYVDGQVLTIEKREMYVTLTKEFTWIDTETGETVGPIRRVVSAVNGMDKSCGTAESLCLRYFLLQYFCFSTRELSDELDTHDCSYIPGLGQQNFADVPQQGMFQRDYQFSPQSPYQPSPYGRPQPVEPQYANRQQFQMQGQYQRGRVQQNRPLGENGANPVEDAASRLANFDPNTVEFKNLLNKYLTDLRLMGTDTTSPAFAGNLRERAIALRENRPYNI